MKKISEMTPDEALTEQALAVFKRRLEQARKKAVESAAATKRETADALQNVGGDSSRKRRAITHTFIIIALSGTVCKGKKSSAKRVFTGSYGILTNRP